MTTQTTPAVPAVLLTAAEFTTQFASRRAELVEGQVQECPMPSFKHGVICSRMDRLLGAFVEAGDLGWIATNDTWIQTGRSPDTVRGADVCYFSYARLPRGPMPEGLLPVAPDLVIEVRSPSDRWTEIFTKVGEYLRAGVAVVVILDPRTETASVYRPDELQQIFHNGDPLVLPDLLPGFSVPLQRLFG